MLFKRLNTTEIQEMGAMEDPRLAYKAVQPMTDEDRKFIEEQLPEHIELDLINYGAKAMVSALTASILGDDFVGQFGSVEANKLVSLFGNLCLTLKDMEAEKAKQFVDATAVEGYLQQRIKLLEQAIDIQDKIETLRIDDCEKLLLDNGLLQQLVTLLKQKITTLESHVEVSSPIIVVT